MGKFVLQTVHSFLHYIVHFLNQEFLFSVTTVSGNLSSVLASKFSAVSLQIVAVRQLLRRGN